MTTPPAFTVDVPTDADAHALADVHVTVWREAYGDLLPPRFFDEDAPAGIELQALNVLAAMHGTGLARTLVEELLGDRPAYLWVADPNPRAQAFYAKLAFAPDGTTRSDPDLEDLREIRLVR